MGLNSSVAEFPFFRIPEVLVSPFNESPNFYLEAYFEPDKRAPVSFFGEVTPPSELPCGFVFESSVSDLSPKVFFLFQVPSASLLFQYYSSRTLSFSAVANLMASSSSNGMASTESSCPTLCLIT